MPNSSNIAAERCAAALCCTRTHVAWRFSIAPVAATVVRTSQFCNPSIFWPNPRSLHIFQPSSPHFWPSPPISWKNYPLSSQDPLYQPSLPLSDKGTLCSFFCSVFLSFSFSSSYLPCTENFILSFIFFRSSHFIFQSKACWLWVLSLESSLLFNY